MTALRFKVGDAITVYAAGLMVELRSVVRTGKRVVVDNIGGRWTHGGERWGFSNAAVDGDYIRQTESTDASYLADPTRQEDRRVAHMRSVLRRFTWQMGARGLEPSAETVKTAYGAIAADAAGAEWLLTNR